RRAEARADYQDFFSGRARPEPIASERDAVKTGGRCDNGKAHRRKLTAPWMRRQLLSIRRAFVRFSLPHKRRVKSTDMGSPGGRSSKGRNAVTLSTLEYGSKLIRVMHEIYGLRQLS